ncbi:MAG: sigma-70 family RNA polymerase sigma factor [Myxococcota bacterium]|nr:sigma-70 family RNA polymerase sigma factor [Myxococcota bacterium]
MGSTIATEAHLVLLIASGDPAAFTEFYLRTSSFTYARALRLTRSPAEAEDLLQDVYLEVWQRAHQFDPSRGPARSWLLVRVRSRALDRLEAQGRRDRAEPQSSGPSSPPAPDERLSGWGTEAKLQGEVERLPVSQQEALRLSYWEGLSSSATAARLQIPVGTVKTRLRLGLSRLSTRLASK